MANRAIAFYDDKEREFRNIVVAFGGFTYAEFTEVKRQYGKRGGGHKPRPFFTRDTTGPRIDYSAVRVDTDKSGNLVFVTPFFREQQYVETPAVGKSTTLELIYAADQREARLFVENKPAYHEALAERVTSHTVARHGGFPLGIAHAWNWQAGVWLMLALLDTHILTPREIEHAYRHGKFMADVPLEELLVQPK